MSNTITMTLDPSTSASVDRDRGVLHVGTRPTGPLGHAAGVGICGPTFVVRDDFFRHVPSTAPRREPMN